MARTITYYVHESWRDGQFTVALHRGDCIHYKKPVQITVDDPGPQRD